MLACCIAVVIILYLHYGIYSYDKLNQKTPIRINRFTGETWLLGDDGIWRNNAEIELQKKEAEEASIRQEQEANEAELRKKDVPVVYYLKRQDEIPEVKKTKTYSTRLDALNAYEAARSEIELDGSINVDMEVNDFEIHWANFDKDELRVTLNGEKLTQYDLDTTVGVYTFKDLSFLHGDNVIEITTSLGKYKYYVKL